MCDLQDFLLRQLDTDVNYVVFFPNCEITFYHNIWEIQ